MSKGKDSGSSKTEGGRPASMVSMHQIEVFRALMVAKTVTAAAEIVHISQPALSRIIKRMEDRVGFRLFDRVKGRLVPTPEAMELYADVEIIHKKIDDLNFSIHRLATGEDVAFRFGASPSLGNSVVPRALRQLRERYPRLVVHVDIVALNELVDYLMLRKGEFVLTVFPIKHPMVRNQKIGVGRMICAFARDHRLARQESISAQDLADEEIIGFDVDSAHGCMVHAIAQAAGVSFRFTTFVRFAETALILAEQGLGVALIDEFTAMGAHRSIGATRPLADPFTLTLYANTSLHHPLSAHGTDFLRILKREIPQSL
ncbi:MAG: LysR family transcriptional regulator [Rhodospirillales bacterium]|nr:LysR family transcriptional regulator [Rhodospirillales bacterium]